MFDSGIRTGKELANIRVSDFKKKDNGVYQLNIRDETSKTFGRKIKLLLCGNMINDYILDNDFRPSDYLFKFQQQSVNKYLARLSEKIFISIIRFESSIMCLEREIIPDI